MSSSPLLSPSWQHTEDLAALDDDEWEEEEVSYLVLDVANQLPQEVLSGQNRFQLAGLASKSPLLRIGNRVFEGRYERLIGTEVVYTDASDPQSPPTLLAATDHRISFSPVHLQPRDPKQDPASYEFDCFKPAQSKRRGRGMGRGRGRGRGEGTPAAAATGERDGTPPPAVPERGKRPRGRPRGSRARGRGRGDPPPAASGSSLRPPGSN